LWDRQKKGGGVSTVLKGVGGVRSYRTNLR